VPDAGIIQRVPLKRFAAVLGIALVAIGGAGSAVAADATRRTFTVDDLDRLHGVADPAMSPDGQWVAYSVRTTDVSKDKRAWHVWMTSWDGRESLQLTQSVEGEHSPGFSPDGRYLAFISDRDGSGQAKLWISETATGKKRKASDVFVRAIEKIQWLPNNRQILLTALPENLTPAEFVQRLTANALQESPNEPEDKVPGSTAVVYRSAPSGAFVGVRAEQTGAFEEELCERAEASVDTVNRIENGTIANQPVDGWPVFTVS